MVVLGCFRLSRLIKPLEMILDLAAKDPNAGNFGSQVICLSPQPSEAFPKQQMTRSVIFDTRTRLKWVALFQSSWWQGYWSPKSQLYHKGPWASPKQRITKLVNDFRCRASIKPHLGLQKAIAAAGKELTQTAGFDRYIGQQWITGPVRWKASVERKYSPCLAQPFQQTVLEISSMISATRVLQTDNVHRRT